MIPPKYLRRIVDTIKRHDHSSSRRWFIFGSCLRKKHFGDVDIAVSGDVKPKDIFTLKEEFEESTIPYKIDIIPFDQSSASFQRNVLNGPVKWIKR